MRVLAFLLAGIILLLLSLAVKAEVDFHYRHIEQKDHWDINFRAFHGLWHITCQIPTMQLEWEKGPQIEVDQVVKARGEIRQATTKARFRYIRRGWLAKLWTKIPNLLGYLHQIRKRFYKGIHCRSIDWRVEIGFNDASATALAAGAFWSMFGFALSRLYRQVAVEVSHPSLAVVPQYKKEGFLCDIRCIFDLRIGHIIFVGLYALKTFKRGIRGQTGGKSSY